MAKLGSLPPGLSFFFDKSKYINKSAEGRNPKYTGSIQRGIKREERSEKESHES